MKYEKVKPQASSTKTIFMGEVAKIKTKLGYSSMNQDKLNFKQNFSMKL